MLWGFVSSLLLGDFRQEHSVPGISVLWFSPSLLPVVSPGTFSVPSQRFFYTCKSSLPWLCTEQRLMSQHCGPNNIFVFSKSVCLGMLLYSCVCPFITTYISTIQAV